MLALVSYAAAFSALTFHLYPFLLERGLDAAGVVAVLAVIGPAQVAGRILIWFFAPHAPVRSVGSMIVIVFPLAVTGFALAPPDVFAIAAIAARSDEHPSELQSLMRSSYAVFCLNKQHTCIPQQRSAP